MIDQKTLADIINRLAPGHWCAEDRNISVAIVRAAEMAPGIAIKEKVPLGAIRYYSPYPTLIPPRAQGLWRCTFEDETTSDIWINCND